MADVFDNTNDEIKADHIEAGEIEVKEDKNSINDIIHTYFLPDNIYKIMKWLGLIFCPLLATFYGTCAPLWGWPNVNEVVGTINAIGVFIGGLIGVSEITKKPM